MLTMKKESSKTYKIVAYALLLKIDSFINKKLI